MSKNDKTVSQKGQDEADPDSVFDFLYHDSRRIASFLSQFDANGLLTGLTQGESVAKGTKRSKKLGIGGDVPLLIGGKVEFEVGPGEVGSQTMERAYDPFWANARQFLDVLTERDLIQRDVSKARIGQFALVTGSLIVSDMAMLQSLWGLPAIKQALAKAIKDAEDAEGDSSTEAVNRQQRRAAQKKKEATPAIPLDLQVTMEVLPHMPHSAHLHIVTDDLAVWAPASEHSLVTPVSDLVLKHGAKVAGQWSMLGILDALPWETDEMMTPLEMIRTGMMSENIAKAALSLAPTIKQAIGRPILSYGMTPLLVFREVA